MRGSTVLCFSIHHCLSAVYCFVLFLLKDFFHKKWADNYMFGFVQLRFIPFPALLNRDIRDVDCIFFTHLHLLHDVSGGSGS